MRKTREEPIWCVKRLIVHASYFECYWATSFQHADEQDANNWRDQTDVEQQIAIDEPAAAWARCDLQDKV